MPGWSGLVGARGGEKRGGSRAIEFSEGVLLFSTGKGKVISKRY